MKNRKTRKAFTLVELLVVITILAVLATVSVIGYKSFTKKAQISNDISLTTQMNTILQANQVRDGKNETPHEAVEELIDGGVNMNKLTPMTNGYLYVFDLEENEMVLLDESMNAVAPEDTTLRTSKTNYFIFVGKDDELKEAKYNGYSFYLKNEFHSGSELSINTGIDVGDNKNITSIKYEHSTGDKQIVTLRTNGGTLAINGLGGDNGDTVNHFGWVKELEVKAVATSDCYHEHGFVGKLTSFASGKFVAYNEARFHQTQAEIEAVLGSNEKDLSKAKFGDHYFNEKGICVIETCTGEDGHRATNGDHEHSYVDGVCECGAKESSTPALSCNPKITIVENNEHRYSLALDETSVKDVDWSRYEIVLRIPFNVAEYVSTSEASDEIKNSVEYEYIEQDYFKGYYKKSTLSEEYKLDFTYSVIKNANNVYIPYDKTTAIAFWNLEAYGITPSGTANYYVTTPEGNSVLTKDVKYSNWGDGFEGYYSTMFTAIGGIDIIDSIFGKDASKTICLLQDEMKIPTYYIHVYDQNNNLIGTKEYPPLIVGVQDNLDSYIAEYEKWVEDNSKENTRETLMNYHNNVKNFNSQQFEIEELSDSMGIGNTGSDIMKSVVTSNVQATTSTFDYYKIVLKADRTCEYRKL